jgi:hypothetical protein
VITVDAVPVRAGAAEVAEKVTVYVPACVKLGVQLNVPDVFPAFAVNELPVVAGELAAVREAIAWPSGSNAVTVKVRFCPSGTPQVCGAVTIGARSASAGRGADIPRTTGTTNRQAMSQGFLRPDMGLSSLPAGGRSDAGRRCGMVDVRSAGWWT